MRNFTDPCYWILQISILTDKIYDRTIGEVAYELMRDFSETLLAYSQRSDLPVKYKNMVERNLHYDRYIEVTDKFKEEYSKEKLPYVFSGWGAYPLIGIFLMIYAAKSAQSGKISRSCANWTNYWRRRKAG